MELLTEEAARILKCVEVVLCDLDDTLTIDGRLPAASLSALEELQKNGRHVIVVTGRPAGWCDMMARFWPVDGVVGENGAFAFRYDHAQKRMLRHYQYASKQRKLDRAKLRAILDSIKKRHPELRLSADQEYRTSDFAIDICEDVTPLSEALIQEIVREFECGGANVKISSIHINAWIGSFNKLQMSLEVIKKYLGLDQLQSKDFAVYVGDSPNDEPMFEYFPLSVGVANIAQFAETLKFPPRWITRDRGGIGFAQFVSVLNGSKA